MSETGDFLLGELKERELEILALMAEGHTNVAIGEKLFITKETVRWYNKQIYSKPVGVPKLLPKRNDWA